MSELTLADDDAPDAIDVEDDDGEASFDDTFTVDDSERRVWQTSEIAYGDIDVRELGLRYAIRYFADVRRETASPRVSVVLDVAQHIATWLETGEMPAGTE